MRWLRPLNHGETRAAVDAERAMLGRLEGGCQVPLGVLATVTGGALAIMGNALLAKYVFKTDVVLPVPALLASMAAAVAVTVITGLLANRGIADHPPLEVLRNET